MRAAGFLPFAIRTLHSRPRRGLTLMEVLIAIFVSTIGLLGLAALIPVGRYNVVEGSKNDRASAVARAAYREIKARRMLAPEMLASPQPWHDVLYPGFSPISDPFVNGNGICIDPLFITRAVIQAGGALPDPWQTGITFPFTLDNDPGDPTSIAWKNTTIQVRPPRLTRVGIRDWYNPVSPPTLISYPAAERLFRSSDDLVFELDPDETKRPKPVWGSDHRMQSVGDYSWVATVTSFADNYWTVSVVVFYKRSPPPALPELTASDINNRTDGPPAERLVYADFLSGVIGWGGGDVRLRLPIRDPNYVPGAPEKSDLPKLRPGQWLMLSAWTNPTRPGWTIGDPDPPSPQPHYEWYRIISIASEPVLESGQWQQEVTLAGPDWAIFHPQNSDWRLFQDVDGGGLPTVFAALFENVVGVYTKTIELDSWAMP